MPTAPIIISEHGLRFEVDVLQGQKTGFFLDQRENRRTIEQWSRGKSVLNLFSYTGGFSVYAARGGATHVTSVDSAREAMATAERNFALNGFDRAQHEFIVADCFDVMERYHGEGRRFDLIIVDPPSFARSKEQVTAALGAYRRLNSLALKCLSPTGHLASSSCTSQVGPATFQHMLARAAADANRRLNLLHDAGQPLDHPVPAHFPEGRYLKFVLGRAEVTL
jgi:23S rRNA (cytosine1962-C5)-methyltransferase